MNINKFIKEFRNHPVLFVGSGLSFRYLKNSYTWDGLLKKIAYDLKENDEYYYDIKSKCQSEKNNTYKYEKIATMIENDFNEELEKDRNGKFKHINDLFYENMGKNKNISRFKLYISEILKKLEYKNTNEITELKKARKNISSVITTNYDTMIEDIFSFNPLIGNDILLSNPYGSLYKIHGCITQPDKIIISEKDYKNFDSKYELIRAQLLSLFIHNPIVFLGYSLSDNNIKQILKTIFTYVDSDSKEAEKIRNNFLLVEYEPNSDNEEVIEHDIDIEGISRIRINKIKTDNYVNIYKALSELELPVSTMDIRKVQNIVKDIYAGGSIKVSITEDLDELENSEKILLIGSKNNIKYVHKNAGEIIKKYFDIIDEENVQLLEIIDKLRIQKQQYFPIYGFSKINKNIVSAEKLKKQQNGKINNLIISSEEYLKNKNINIIGLNIENIDKHKDISNSKKNDIIAYAALKQQVTIEELKNRVLEVYEKIEKETENKNETLKTKFKMMICVYDYLKFKE